MDLRINIKYSNVIIMVLLSFILVFCSSTFTLIASFYPTLEHPVKLEPNEVGIVLAMFEVGNLVFGLIFMFMCRNVRMWYINLCGIFVCAASTLLFSFVGMVNEKKEFVLASIAIRVLQGSSCFAVQTSCIAIASRKFPNALSKAMGIIETANGIGFAIGPPIGGFLYEIGGFALPFRVQSGICFVLFVIAICLTTDEKCDIVEKNDNSLKISQSASSLLKIRQTYVLILQLVIFTCSYVFFDISLAPFFDKNFGLKQFEIGLVFAGECMTYSIAGPFIGHFVDKFKHPELFMIFGALLNSIAFIFLGPSKFLHINSKLWIAIFSCAVAGFSMALMYIPTMEYILNAIRKNDMEADTRMINTLSSALSFGASFGGLIGPIIGGFLLQSVGFQNTCSYIALSNLCMVIVVTLSQVIPPRKITKKTRLLRPAVDDQENLIE